MSDFNAFQQKRLKKSAERLVSLISHGAPSIIIANAVTLLVTTVTALWGPVVFEEIGKKLQSYVKMDAGFCRYCEGNPRIATAPNYVCDVCESQFEKLNRADDLASDDDPIT